MLQVLHMYCVAVSLKSCIASEHIALRHMYCFLKTGASLLFLEGNNQNNIKEFSGLRGWLDSEMFSSLKFS